MLCPRLVTMAAVFSSQKKVLYDPILYLCLGKRKYMYKQKSGSLYVRVRMYDFLGRVALSVIFFFFLYDHLCFVQAEQNYYSYDFHRAFLFSSLQMFFRGDGDLEHGVSDVVRGLLV